MTKQTFKPAVKGKRLPAIAYTPLIYIAGTQVHRLALHKDLNRALPDEMRGWIVSEPVTGMCVREVTNTFKGVTVSSRGLSPSRAREAAMATLDALCERIGSDKFNLTINNAKENV